VHGCPKIDGAGNPLFKDDTHLRASFVRDRFDALDRFVYDDLHAPIGSKRAAAGTDASLASPAR